MDWNGAAGNPAANPPTGYCTHVSNLFLPWHRPYLAVYEQILVQNAVDIANEFQGSDQQRYRDAAATLRIPYWDWAAPQNGGNIVPDVLVQNQISVNTPSGQRNIDNPLYSYKFTKATQNLIYSPFVSWTQTYRNPVSQDNPTQNNDQGIIDTMNGQQASLASRLFNLFANYNNFAQVSNEAWAQGQQGSYDSIESIHDTIHGLFGGANNGDMSIIDVSAFDPAFWLHHTMVDRFFAMWQALYPDTYVDPAPQVYSNYWYAAGTNMDANSPLVPFHSDTAGNFHTSNSVRDHTRFGYTYSEISGDPQSVVEAVNRLYGAGQPQAGNKKRSPVLGDITGILTEVGDAVTDALGPVGDIAEDVAADAQDIVNDINGYLGIISPRDYLVNVRTDKNALDGSYQIFVFCGDVPEDRAEWAKSDTLVGIQAITSMKQGYQMGPAIVAGTIPLTKYLEKHVVLNALAGLSEDLVVPYLTDNLTWRVIGVRNLPLHNPMHSTNMTHRAAATKSLSQSCQTSSSVSYPWLRSQPSPSPHSHNGSMASPAITKSRAARTPVCASRKRTKLERIDTKVPSKSCGSTCFYMLLLLISDTIKAHGQVDLNLPYLLLSNCHSLSAMVKIPRDCTCFACC